MVTDETEFLCTLENKFPCPYRKEGNKCSDAEAKCGFMQKIEVEKVPEPKPFVRQKRWYEQYYEGAPKKDKWITNRWD